MSVLDELKPKRVFHYFEEICRIPHGSGNSREISRYLVSFADAHGLLCSRDTSNNVIIQKPAGMGYENAAGVILQGHMDMVCEKKKDSGHDFEKDFLKLGVDGDFIYARDTTLGGDDGIAVAYMLAILEDDLLLHPALECVFTTDEEIGLLGAHDLDVSVLKGRRMINLDSEEEGGIWVSCAGGMTVQAKIPVTRVKVDGVCCELRIDGLLGGHSGAEIDKIRANANILMGRFLYELEREISYYLCDAAGGAKDNAIPRMSRAAVVVENSDMRMLEKSAKRFQEALRKEYAHTDDGISVTVADHGAGTYKVLSKVSHQKLVFFLMNVPNGIQKMSGSVDGLVETSCNLGILFAPSDDDYIFAVSSVRSAAGSAKTALGEKICYLTEFLGGVYYVKGDYPAWEYRAESPLREMISGIYQAMYHKEPRILATHAGLECGLFYGRLEGLDCVSIGPDMIDIHTSEERLSISSVARVYEYLLKILAAMKE